MPTDQYPFTYDEWLTLTLSGKARTYSFPALGAEGSDVITPLPRTGGGGGGEPEAWVKASAFKFDIDATLEAKEDELPPADQIVEIAILDHFPKKKDIINQLTALASKTGADPIFQLMINGLNGPTLDNFEITVDDRQPLLKQILGLDLPPPPADPEVEDKHAFARILQAYENDGGVRPETGHGIFIAGVVLRLLAQQHGEDVSAVRSLPNVKLRLVSVLNHKQLGLISDIAAVIREMKAAHRNDPNVQRLVNCSIQVFTPFDPPLGLSEGEMRKFVWNLLNFVRSAVTDIGPIDIVGTVSDLVRGKLSMVEIMAEIMMGVSNIFEVGELLQLTTFLEKMPNFEIIAAAGNIPASISLDNDAKPLPTYPAHIHTVIGVGALGNDASTLAPFSRRFQVRRTSVDGLATLGDVVGPYIGDISTLPLGSAVDTSDFEGFVKWAGTSFSTAVITGLMARLCRRGKSAEEAFGVLRAVAEGHDASGSVLPILVSQS